MNQITRISENWSLNLSDKIEKTVPATIPGCIHTDLITAKLIDDISIDGIEEEQNWIGKTKSTYSTKLLKRQPGTNYYLKFYGLDTLATITLNGFVKLKTKNMHRSYIIDITEEIVKDNVLLRVDFEAPLLNAEKQVRDLGLYPRPYDMPYNYQRKMACSYGWDWGPTTISSGIWKPVELISFKKYALNRFSAITEVVNGKGQVKVKAELLGNQDDIQIKCILKDGHGVLAQVTTDKSEFTFEELDIELWYPRGFGPQKLYQLEIKLLDNGNVIQQDYKTIGFRLIELDTSAIDEKREKFAIKINGERIWIKGANWIPDDPFPSRITKERYEKRISDILEANINGLRVWGGGIYESEDFYDLCNREGIVVWQDFLFACAAYPETPEMFDEVVAEVEENVDRLGSHPSLVIWCGGNECLEGFQHWGWKELLADKPWGETFYRQTIPNLLTQWDQTRPYIPSSPFSTIDDDVKSFNSGTNHIWDVWNDVGYERYEEYEPSFAAEFGYNGPGSWSMLSKAIGTDNLDSRDPKLHVHQKAFDGMKKIAAGLTREFANPPVEGPAWYFAAALVQARAVEVGLKHFRALYETCSGTILWQYNDMWPVLSWSVSDSTSFRKLSWHALKSAYLPRTLAVGRVDQGAKLSIINDSNLPWETNITISLINNSGKIVDTAFLPFTLRPFEVQNTSLTKLFPIIADGNYDGFLHAENSEMSTSRRTTLLPAASAPKQEIEILSSTLDSSLQIHLKARTYIYQLCALPELFSQGVNSDKQLITLLPDQDIKFTITGAQESLIRIKNSMDSLFWSHNKLLNI